MKNNIRSILAALFAGTDHRSTVDFSWRLIYRRRRPFLLLPESFQAACTGMSLYSAQRKRAKIWRRVLPTLFQTPLSGLLSERIQIRAEISGEIIQFMAAQVGVEPERVVTPAIKISEVGDRIRLVLLLCDESGRPARVIKVGLNDAGRQATDREADMLAQLPADRLGSIRVTGRFSSPKMSAFATEYFPGTSPFDDAGLEHLFHDWLNPHELVAPASLPLWQELDAAVGEPYRDAWWQIQSVLADKKIRTTLYHGDFAPWNIRVVSSRNLQTFDWERGRLRGLPGWDWFHFTIQTAILARRHSAERAAAEIEVMIHSPRFQKYAAAAGISEVVEPLVLSYLLHHLRVNRPLEGGQTCADLFNLLNAHWLMKPTSTPEVMSVPECAVSVRQQLGNAIRQWNNLFWEPSLNSIERHSWLAEFKASWIYLLTASLVLGLIGLVQFNSSSHIMFLPFYGVISSFLAWKAGRRWGMVFVVVAAATAPLVVALKDPSFREPGVMLWNTIMRFIILEMFVIFTDRIHQHRQVVHYRQSPDIVTRTRLAENWAVLLTCGLALLGIAWLDYITDPHMIFLPLYLIPCMMLTLVFNLRWGITAALLATGIGCWVEYVTNRVSHYTLGEVFGWNYAMRFGVALVVLLLLNRIRRENILFSSVGKGNEPSPAPAANLGQPG